MSTKEIERARIIPDVVDGLAHSKVQISASFGSIPVVLGEHIAPKDVSGGGGTSLLFHIGSCTSRSSKAS